MTPNHGAVKDGWHVHAPHGPAAGGSKGDAYKLTFGKFKGSRLADVPAEYLLWLSDFSDSPALRLLARKALELDVMIDDGDPARVAGPSPELAAHVVPRVCFEFEAALKAELGHLDPGTVEAATVERAKRVLRDVVTSYTGRAFGAEGGAA